MKTLTVTLVLCGHSTLSMSGDAPSVFDNSKEPVELVTGSYGTLECWSTKRVVYEAPNGSSDFFKACVKAYAERADCDIETALGRLQRLEVLQDEKTSGYFLKLVERRDL